MKNIIENMAKLVSKIILRIFLIILFFFIILAITKINKNVLAFAETVEALGNSNTDNNENKFFKILEENQNQINNKYITASMQSSNQYPQNWLNEFNKKIIELQLIFPNDMYWNHMGESLVIHMKTIICIVLQKFRVIIMNMVKDIVMHIMENLMMFIRMKQQAFSAEVLQVY